MRQTALECCLSCVAATLILTAGASAAEADWPWYRGPDTDGISKETDWNPSALAGGAKVLWRVDVGQGWGTVAVKGPRVFVMGNKGGDDKVQCLDIKNGAELWVHSYPCSAGGYAGPRSTPAIDNGLVYSVSRDGHVFCLDADKGTVKWEKNITSEFDAKPNKWGHSGSARLSGNMLILNAGKHGLALDKESGKKIWSSGGGIGGYATPVIYGEGAGTHAVIFAEKEICGVDLKDGTKVWSVPWVTRYDVNAADPIVFEDKVFFSSGYGRGCGMISGITGGKIRKVWENKSMANHIAPVVLIKGLLYGIDGNAGGSCKIKCLDPNTGNEKWAYKTDFSTIGATPDKLIILDEKGVLAVADASPEGYREHSRAKVVNEGKCWTAPVLCRGMIFCRSNAGELVCVNMK